MMPSAINAEKSLLGSILINSDLIPEAMAIIPLDAFYDSFNKEIYKAMAELHDDGVTPDIVLLYDKIKGDSGVEARLYELGECATSTSIKEYCRLITEKWVRRKIIEDCSLLSRSAKNNGAEIGDISSQFENISFTIGDICDKNNIKRRKRGQLIRVNDFRDRVIDYYENGFKNIGISAGWKALDPFYRPAKGTLNIVTGIPGHGKSEFIDAIVVNTAQNKGWKWAIFSPENYPYELHIQKIAEKFIRKPLLRGARMIRAELESALKWIQEYMVFIEPDEDNLSLDAIMKLQLNAIEKYKIDGIVVDPWNEIEMVLRNGESETDYIGRSLARIRRFARKHNIVYYIVAHPAKMYKDKDGNYSVPTMYNISGSAHWYNKADNGLCVHRDFINNMIDLHIQKIKFKIHGKVGCVPFSYVKDTGCFEGVDF